MSRRKFIWATLNPLPLTADAVEQAHKSYVDAALFHRLQHPYLCPNKDRVPVDVSQPAEMERVATFGLSHKLNIYSFAEDRSHLQVSKIYDRSARDSLTETFAPGMGGAEISDHVESARRERRLRWARAVRDHKNTENSGPISLASLLESDPLIARNILILVLGPADIPTVDEFHRQRQTWAKQ